MKKKSIVTAIAVAASLVGALRGPAPSRATAQDSSDVREIEVVVRGGYTPHRITIRAGERVRLRFVRHEYSSCTREVVFPSLSIRRELPPHQPVVIDLPTLAPGEHEFRCGMNMVRATIIVEAR
ncbi:MAG: cupredoxin domain-containing protein [Myxococcales bacterium]|nr:cupredoxin domain-containing protein [Myxococcales bacterium]